ncbi:CotH kinase family protein [Paenibacillus sp. WQ 127069]|uniref:CotH kinase family protein n=1 Tax=Paenibacillus baimaensis TaxID=2982185 RepID=A0ABT2UP16_9BACL|nr:CotH kinase family protein [Paenibacillus sp. WQ 127069]MCU6796400.1 CotH kinase family protein [Paenibacillus sp. WQ 127069]
MDSPREIPTYQIFINKNEYQTLRDHMWSEESVSAKLKVNQKQYAVGIAYRGYHIRKLKKKSFRLTIQSPKLFMGAREYHLNAEYSDPSMIRSKLSFDFFKDIGNLAPSAEHILLKLNGSIAGVYLQLESVDDLFLTSRGLQAGHIFYASNDDANFSLITPENTIKQSLEAGYSLKIGFKEDYKYIRELIYKINTVARSDFKNEISKLIDVNKFLIWLVGVVCTQNYDGFIQNYALYRSGASGLFEIIPWDYDATWGRDIYGQTMEHDYVPIQGYNTLISRLMDVPEFRLMYKSLLETILEIKFNANYLEPHILSLQSRIRPYILLDPYKSKDISSFDMESEFIIQFINNRRAYLKDHLVALN